METDSVLNEKSQLVTKEDNEVEDKEERCSSCLRFPKAVYFLVLLELCERFNYYGMRTLLIIYLTQHLQLTNDNAVSIYHMFVSLCYLTTIVGSFLADNYLGRYKTLLILGIIYTVGSVLMSVTAIPAMNLAGPLISLLLIAFGTGGVKACVAPFGGDQIPPDKPILMDSFFSTFYFAINLGSLVSTILTPILRADIACNGSDDCYPLAFGVPAILMVVALIILIAGRNFYKIMPVKESVYIRSVRCIMISIRNWFRERHTNPRKHLLDYSSKEYDDEFIGDLRALYRILIIYLPLPIFWALYDQIGSKWTLQAAQMDGEIGTKLILLPDQMSLFNVIFIMILIPIFDGCIYPIVDRIFIHPKPLHRMVVGIAIAALSFFAAFVVSNRIESLMPTTIASNASRTVLVNGLPCDTSLYVTDGRQSTVGAFQTSPFFVDLVPGSQQVQLNFSKCSGMVSPLSISATVVLYPAQINFIVADLDIYKRVTIRNVNDFHSSNIKGHPLFRLVASSSELSNYQFQLKHAFTGTVQKSFTVASNESLYASSWVFLNYPGRYLWNYKTVPGLNNSIINPWLGALISNQGSLQVDPIKFRSSAVSLFYMTNSGPDKTVVVIPMEINKGAQMSILWQIPQYILISIGEILVSITGLSFSYAEAPASMKSLVNALWFFTVSFGNLIVMVVVKIRFTNKESWEFFIFAIVCLVFDVIFAILTTFYKTRQEVESEKVIEVMSPDDSSK